MKIKPGLGGGKFGDPSLYIDVVDRKRGILFDCGLNNFGHASLRKISDIFISHTHIDHFIGFDIVLRMNLAEAKTLHIYGPPGIRQNVIGKLHGYTWNICHDLDLIIRVHEIFPETIISTELESCTGFAVKREHERDATETLLDTGEFAITYIQLDHKTPSFGYSFLEADSFNVRKDELRTLGLEPGPWVAALKKRALDPEQQHVPLEVGTRTYTTGFLSERLLSRKKGVKITYLTDFLYDDRYSDKIAQFAWESDMLFCESAFSEKDREKAKASYHLTAREAGTLARIAQVKQLILFHLSRRYQDYSELLEEAKLEFPHVE